MTSGSAPGSRLPAPGSHNESRRTKPPFVKSFFEPSITFPLGLNVVPPPVSEAPHDTGVSGFVEVSKGH